MQLTEPDRNSRLEDVVAEIRLLGERMADATKRLDQVLSKLDADADDEFWIERQKQILLEIDSLNSSLQVANLRELELRRPS